jgi:autonomous glycyl radical cofactor GrcA
MDALGALALGLLGAGLYLDDTSSNSSSSTEKSNTDTNETDNGVCDFTQQQQQQHQQPQMLTQQQQQQQQQQQILTQQQMNQINQMNQMNQMVGGSCENANTVAGHMGYLNQIGPLPDMPEAFQLELYNTLQLSESERKIKNPNWDPRAVLAGLPNCALQSGQDNPGDEYKQELDACRGTQQVVPKYQLNLQSNKYCMEPHNAMSIPYDDSDRNKPESMTHTNMVPFYRGTITQNLDPNNRLGAGKLELYTGNYKLRQDNKQEVGQFFAPTTGLGLPYGSHECRDLSRYNPNNLGKRNNEKPFQDVHVGRGLNKGFTNEGSGGFHDMLRIVPKRNDQQYVNPKSESKGLINHGKSVNDNGTLRPVMYKYRTNLLVDNESGQRNFSSVGQVKGRRLRPDVILKDTNRTVQRALYGPRNQAVKTMSTSQNLIAKSKVSSKQNFANSPFRNVKQETGKRHNDYGQSGIENRPTERTMYSDKTYWGHIKTWVDRVINDFTDTARHTRKQDNICAERKTGPGAGNVGQNTSKHVGKAYDPTAAAKPTIRETTQDLNYNGLAKGKLGSVVYDPTNVPKTTIRQTTENLDYNGLAKGKLGSVVYDPTSVPKTTIRQTTENLDYNGLAKGKLSGKVYDPTDVPKTTVRQTTENLDYNGVVKGQLSGKVYDPTNVPKTTIRQTTENLDYNGAAKGKLASVVYDPSNAPKTTIRQTTENLDYNGLAKGKLASVVYDPTNVPKTTIRQTTENLDYNGNAKGKLSGKVYDPTDAPKTTIRQTTENLDYNGAAKGKLAGKAYDPTDAPKTTVRETTENLNYKGNISGAPVKKSIAYDPTDAPKTTVKETTENCEYQGGANPVMHRKSIAYDPTDVTKTTIRQTTENNDYLGGPSSETFQNGGGYEVTSACAPATQRQFSLRSYAGGADAVNPAMTSYDAGYNMRFNPATELLVVDYAQQPGKVIPLGDNNTPGRYEVKKLEDDRVNRWMGMKNTSIENYFNPTSVTSCTVTSEKNRLPEEFTRLDTRILDAYKNNPLTQSLNSYA